MFQKDELKPYPFEQTLWQMYDCPVWVRNLRMLPTIAYSGEIDAEAGGRHHGCGKLESTGTRAV